MPCHMLMANATYYAKNSVACCMIHATFVVLKLIVAETYKSVYHSTFQIKLNIIYVSSFSGLLIAFVTMRHVEPSSVFSI